MRGRNIHSMRESAKEMQPVISHPQPRPGILDIAPYVPGRTKSTGGSKLHKLSSNETPLGACELV